MLKKTTYILLLLFLASCSDTWDSVKRGLTGEKKNSTDEFLVKKKDPLILPPDYENLPTPDETNITLEEVSIFEKSLESDDKLNSETENTESGSTSVESSILKKIQRK